MPSVLSFYIPHNTSRSRERRLAHDNRRHWRGGWGGKAPARGVHDLWRVLRKERRSEDEVYVKEVWGPRPRGGKAKGEGRVCGCVLVGQSKP
jgi:hypothetical protein